MNRCFGAAVEGGIFGKLLFDRGKQERFFLVGGIIENGDVLLGLRPKNHKTRGIATVIENHVGSSAIAPLENAVGVSPIFFEGFTLNRKDGGTTSCNRSRRMVLGGENVAGGPAHISAEFFQGFDQNCGLDRHVERTSNSSTLQGLFLAVLRSQCHQTRHLGLGDVKLLAAKIGKVDIGNNAISTKLQLGRGCGRCHHDF